MLVLSRKVDETIVIDGNITITVTRISGDIVRLGFDAPRDVKIYRGEVWRHINQQGKNDENIHAL